MLDPSGSSFGFWVQGLGSRVHGVIWGLYWDNGKNGNYYLRLRVWGYIGVSYTGVILG